MTRHTLTIQVPPNLWLTANQRLHWSTRMRRTKMLRAYAASEARIHGLAGRRLGPCVVTAVIGYPTRGRADPTNAAPTVKAIVDGLVDARVWDDDDHTHLPLVTFARATDKTPKGTHTVTLIIREQESDKMPRYSRGQFTATFFPPNGVPAGAVIALLSQLRLGALIDDARVEHIPTMTGPRRLVINYREPAEEEA